MKKNINSKAQTYIVIHTDGDLQEKGYQTFFYGISTDCNNKPEFVEDCPEEALIKWMIDRKYKREEFDFTKECSLKGAHFFKVWMAYYCDGYHDPLNNVWELDTMHLCVIEKDLFPL